MSDRILSVRVSLADRLFQAQALPCKSREVSLAVTALQAGRMLLGSVALAMGAVNPYPQADNPASKEIAPSADIPPATLALKETEPVAAVKELRALLDGDIKHLLRLRRELWARHYGSLEEALFDRALTELILAKQWLGEQLAVLAGHPLVKRAPEGKSALMEQISAHLSEKMAILSGSKVLPQKSAEGEKTEAAPAEVIAPPEGDGDAKPEDPAPAGPAQAPEIVPESPAAPAV